MNARTEEEVEPEVVMAAVLKASATTYNFNERSEMNDKTAPVVSIFLLKDFFIVVTLRLEV